MTILGLLLLLLAACGGAGDLPSAPSDILTPLPTDAAAGVATLDAPPAATRRPVRLRPGDLVLAADVDAIPAIFAGDDLFVDAAAGSREWLDAELVIGLALNGEARAYPVRLLSLHEIVNDTVGGQPVAVTWCPLCFSAIAFDRVVAGRELTFGVSGYLYHNNLVMYDHQGNTLWSQLLGQAIRGGQRGETLRVLPLRMTSWADWKAAYPDTRVLSAAQMGRQAAEVVDPYAGYYASGSAGLTGSQGADGRLPPKELVVGLTVGEAARAYPLRTLTTQNVINDTLGALPLLVVVDEGLETAVVFQRSLNGQTLTFTATGPGLLRDAETGSAWQVRSGAAIEGPLAGAQLAQLSAPLVYWFAWSDAYPQTTIWEEGTLR